MPTLEQFNGLLVALYNGPREESPWNSFLDQLCALLAAHTTVIVLARPRPGDPGITFTGGMHFDRGNQLQYANDYAALDPFVNLPDAGAVTLEDMLPLERLKDSAYYRDFMQPTDSVQLLGIDIFRDSSVSMSLRAIRGERDPRFGDEEKSLFNLLGPHLRQLRTWLDRDQHRDFERRLYDGIASRLEMGTVLLDRHGAIVYCNPVARLRLETGQYLRARNGKLTAPRTGDNRRLQEAIGKCLETDRAPSLTQAISLTGNTGEGHLFLMVKPLQVEAPEAAPRNGAERQENLQELHGGEQAPRVAVYISTPEALSTEQQEILQQLFDFTPSEARLAISLANGMNLDEIAHALSVTRNTLRTHLRGAFQKTGVNQQSALVSLVLRSVAGLG